MISLKPPRLPREDLTLILLHLPKTGGLTLRSVVGRNYPPDLVHTVDGSPGSADAFVNLPERRRQQIRLLQGHIPFGLHPHLRGRVSYVTMLRHPVERVISLYYYVRGTPDNPLHEAARTMSLAAFVESGTPQVLNHQTRLIAGREDDFTAATLPAAKENLDSRFAAVGLVERFDESLVLFRKLLGWERIHYVKGNVTRGRPRRSEVPPASVRLIEERNGLDLELYEYAEKKFGELAREYGATFGDDARAFRRSNRVYGGLMSCYDAARRTTPAPVVAAVRRVVRR